MAFKNKEYIENLFDKFNDFIKSKTIVGESIHLGDITLIPITDITFWISGGGGEGKDKNDSGGSGGMAAIAAKAAPKAILMIKGSETKLFPIKNCGSFETLLENVPDLVDKIKSVKEN